MDHCVHAGREWKLNKLLKAAVLVAIPLALYWRSRKAPLVFDDVMIPHHPLNNGKWDQQLTAAAPRALTWASMAWNTRHFGTIQPNQTLAERDRALFGFHIVNMGLHSLNGLLAWWVYAKLGRRNPWLSALLFSVHPLCTSSVSYISGRSAVLSGTLSLAAMGAMASKRPVLSMVPLSLACLAKEDSAAVALAMVAAGRKNGVRAPWLAFLPLIVAGIWKRQDVRNVLTFNGTRGIEQCGMSGALPTPDYQTTAFTELVKRLPQWALGQKHSVDPIVPVHQWRDPSFHLAAVSSLAVFALMRCNPDTRLTAWWLIGSPLSAYVLTPMPDPVMEYRAYFTTAGLAHGLGEITDRVPLATLPMALYFAIRTYQRNGVYSDSIKYWESAERKDRAMINLGAEWLRKSGEAQMAAQTGRQTARNHFNEALTVNPDLALARSNLALMDRAEGRLKEAIEGFNETLKRSPEHTLSWHYLGTCFEQNGQLDDAARAYQKAIDTEKYVPAMNRLGIVKARQQQLPEALPHFREAYRREPDNTDYAFNTAITLKMLGRLPEAIPILKTLPREMPVTTEMLVIQEEKEAVNQ